MLSTGANRLASENASDRSNCAQSANRVLPTQGVPVS